MKDEILIKFLLNETTVEENAAVKMWLSETEQHRIYLSQLESIWMESKNLRLKSEVDVDAAWTKFKSKTKHAAPVAMKMKSTPIWMRMAAVFVLAIGSWLIYSVYHSRGYTDLMANTSVVSQVLPDGSELTLNKFSHVKFANNFESNRSIQLDSGEVFFKVTKDKSKPFIVEIDEVDVEVIGTSFNIKHLRQQTEVIVETGIVKVSLGGSEVLLHKGEKVVIRKGAVKLNKALVKDQLYTYYRTNLFVADNTPLSELAAILTEAYGKTVVADPSVANLPVNTTLLYRKTLDQNLKTILETFENLKLKRNQNEIILSY